jgi:2-polyprenyl-6-methoxyphenol hydroxylase-like FAD-dependent oxidoreductase
VSDIEVPVLIVGGSLVGMSAALFLAQHGVRSLAVEYHRGTAIHPRAAQATQRTMELFRAVGLERLICERSAEQFVPNGGVVAVETLAGGLTTEFIADLNEGIRDVSPCERVFLSQNALEPLLEQRALELGAEFRFATQVLALEQDSGGVTTRLRHRDTSEITTVRSQYVIAADGAHSRMREQLGIGVRGRGTFSKSVTIYFRAPLRPFLADKKWAVVYVNNRQLRGFFRFEKPFESAFLVVNTAGDPEAPDTDLSAGLSDDRARQFVHMALGATIPVTIENVMHWNASADVATEFSKGRVFIAGDAAHVMPPNGGFGGNTGIQDAHNLAWKLALVLSGRAGPSLLQTYAAERQPPAMLTVEQAYTRYVVRTDPHLKPGGMAPLVPDLNIELGYVYRSAAIEASEPDDGALHLSPRESRGRPGTRAPHVWLERDATRISTLDLFGTGFTLLTGRAAVEWCRCGRSVAAETGIPLTCIIPGKDGISDPDDRLEAAYGIGPTGCALIRPDGFVAWRAPAADPPSAQKLATVLQTILGLGLAGTERAEPSVR